MLGSGLVHGMYNPATVWSSDTGMYFDGVNDNAVVQLPSEILNGFTISMWVKTPNETYLDSPGDPNAIIFAIKQGIGKSTGPFLEAYYKDDGTDKIIINRTNAGATSAHLVDGSFNDADWQADFHFVLSVTPAEMVGYKNGVKFTGSQASSSGDWNLSSELIAENYYLHFGHQNNPNGANQNFSEYHIHDINVWGGVIPQQRVTNVYNNGEPKDETNNTHGTSGLYQTFDSNNNFAGILTTTALINGYEPS